MSKKEILLEIKENFLTSHSMASFNKNVVEVINHYIPDESVLVPIKALEDIAFAASNPDFTRWCSEKDYQAAIQAIVNCLPKKEQSG